MKCVLRFAVVVLILFYNLPAFSGQFEIQTGPGWIKAKADGVPLGQVLSQVAGKTGYKVYIDEELEKAPVTFSFQNNLPPEKAIKRMVRPHSYAMVFGSDTKDNTPNILEVWIFRKGHQLKTRYVAVTPASAGSVSADSGSASDGSAGLSDSPQAFRGKDYVRRDLYVKRNAYGAPVFTERDPKRGPDYRPSVSEMQRAYWRSQAEKRQREKRVSDGLLKQRRKDFEQKKKEHRAQRNEEIRQYISGNKQNENK